MGYTIEHRVEDQQFMFLIQVNFLTQHALEPTRGTRLLDLVLSSPKEFVDNIKIQEPSATIISYILISK